MTAGTDLGCAGAGAPPALILNPRWLSPPQSCGRAGAAPLFPRLLGPQGDLERSGAGHLGMPGLSHQGDLGAVHPTQLTEHSQEQEGRAPEVGSGPGCATGPGRWPGCSCLPQSPGAAVAWRGRGVAGGTVPASLNIKTATTCIFNSPVPPTAARMPGRPPTCTEHPPPQSRRVRSGQGQGAASGGCWIPWL